MGQTTPIIKLWFLTFIWFESFMNVLHRGDSVCIGPKQFIMYRLHIGEDVYKTYGWILSLFLVLFTDVPLQQKE